MQAELRDSKPGVQSTEGETDKIAFFVVIFYQCFGQKSGQFFGSEFNTISKVVHYWKDGDFSVCKFELVGAVEGLDSLLEQTSADVVSEDKGGTHGIIESKMILLNMRLK